MISETERFYWVLRCVCRCFQSWHRDCPWSYKRIQLSASFYMWAKQKLKSSRDFCEAKVLGPRKEQSQAGKHGSLTGRLPRTQPKVKPAAGRATWLDNLWERPGLSPSSGNTRRRWKDSSSSWGVLTQQSWLRWKILTQQSWLRGKILTSKVLKLKYFEEPCLWPMSGLRFLGT